MSWFSVCLQATPALLQAMEYSVHRLVLAAVASRHKDVNEHCRHLSQSWMVLALKGSSSYTAGNFLWFQHQIKRQAFKMIVSLKIQPATDFQVHFKIMKHFYMVGNSNLHQKKAELSQSCAYRQPCFSHHIVSCWVQGTILQTFAVINIQNKVEKDKRILGNSKTSFLTTSFNKRGLFKILKIPVFLKSHSLEYFGGRF